MYEGYWRNNKRHGPGRVITFDGNIYEAEFEEDQIKSGIISQFVAYNSDNGKNAEYGFFDRATYDSVN